MITDFSANNPLQANWLRKHLQEGYAILKARERIDRHQVVQEDEKMKECPICGGEVREVRTELSLFNGKVRLNPITGFECPKCEEIFIDEEEPERIDRWVNEPTNRRLLDELKEHEFRLRRKVGYSGRTLIVRVPKDIERVVSLKEGDEVEIYPEGKNRIVIEKL